MNITDENLFVPLKWSIIISSCINFVIFILSLIFADHLPATFVIFCIIGLICFVCAALGAFQENILFLLISGIGLSIITIFGIVGEANPLAFILYTILIAIIFVFAYMLYKKGKRINLPFTV